MNPRTATMAGDSFTTAPFPHFSGQGFLGQPGEHRGSSNGSSKPHLGASRSLLFYEQYEFSVADAETSWLHRAAV